MATAKTIVLIILFGAAVYGSGIAENDKIRMDELTSPQATMDAMGVSQ